MPMIISNQKKYVRLILSSLILFLPFGYAQAADVKASELCRSMIDQIQKAGISQGRSSQYVNEVVNDFRSGMFLDYYEFTSASGSKKFITTDVFFSELFFLRQGRTQVIGFDMLKRLPRSGIKMDYIVYITSTDSVDAKKVRLVIKKATEMGVRIFPVWAGQKNADPMLLSLAYRTRGALIDFSGFSNPCMGSSGSNKMTLGLM